MTPSMTTRNWAVTKLVLDGLIIIATVLAWITRDIHPDWTVRLGGLILVWTLIVHVIVLGPGRDRTGYRTVATGWRIVFGGIALFGSAIVTFGLVTQDPNGVTVGATLISGSELSLAALRESGQPVS